MRSEVPPFAPGAVLDLCPRLQQPRLRQCVQHVPLVLGPLETRQTAISAVRVRTGTTREPFLYSSTP
jgi:hypothetical protein